MKPYGYVRKDGEGLFIYGEHQFQNAMGAELVPVYLHPKEWVGLTDDDCLEALKAVDPETKRLPLALSMFAANIQAKLKEKNT